MRNYENEIEQLKRDIEDLNLEKQDKETQLQRVIREQKKKQDKETQLQRATRVQKRTKSEKNTQALDKTGKAICIGNRVTATTSGKFKENSGIVTDIKKWITFTDANGVKQVRAPNNLLIRDDWDYSHVRCWTIA